MLIKKKCIESIYFQFQNQKITELEKNQLVASVLAADQVTEDFVADKLHSLREIGPALVQTLARLDADIETIETELAEHKLRVCIGLIAEPAGLNYRQGRRIIQCLNPIIGLVACESLKLTSDSEDWLRGLGVGQKWQVLDQMPQFIPVKPIGRQELAICKIAESHLLVFRFEEGYLERKMLATFFMNHSSLLEDLSQIVQMANISNDFVLIKCRILLVLCTLIQSLPQLGVYKLLLKHWQVQIEPAYGHNHEKDKLILRGIKITGLQSQHKLIDHAIQKHLQRLEAALEPIDNYLKIVYKLIYATAQNSPFYACFYRQELVYICGALSHELCSDLGDISAQRNLSFSAVRRSIGLYSESLNQIEYSCSRYQRLLHKQYLILKDEDILQLLVVARPGSQPALKGKSQLSIMRNAQREMCKSNIRKGIAMLSYICDYMPQEEVQPGRQKSYSKASIAVKERKREKNKLVAIIDLKDLPLPPLDFETRAFNALAVEENQLFQHVYHTFMHYGMLQKDDSCMDKFGSFLAKLHHHYQKYSNPFHNFKHGVTVMQGTVHFSRCPQFELYFNSFWKLAFIFAGLCHDVGHTGRNNAFEIASNSKLASRYFQRSVLESHHIALTFKILSQDNSNFLQNIGKIGSFKLFRKIVSECILSTDGRFHSPKLNELTFLLQSGAKNPKIYEEEENKLVILGNSIHGADFYGNVQPFQISRKWAQNLHKEFKAQYQLEHEMQLEQTPFFAFLDDPVKTAESEAIFISNIVLPVWRELSLWYSDWLGNELENIGDNIRRWGQLKRA